MDTVDVVFVTAVLTFEVTLGYFVVLFWPELTRVCPPPTPPCDHDLRVTDPADGDEFEARCSKCDWARPVRVPGWEADAHLLHLLRGQLNDWYEGLPEAEAEADADADADEE